MTYQWRIYSIEGPPVYDQVKPPVYDEVSGDDIVLSDEGVLTFYEKSHLIAVYPRGMWIKAHVLKPNEEVK